MFKNSSAPYGTRNHQRRAPGFGSHSFLSLSSAGYVMGSWSLCDNILCLQQLAKSSGWVRIPVKGPLPFLYLLAWFSGKWVHMRRAFCRRVQLLCCGRECWRMRRSSCCATMLSLNMIESLHVHITKGAALHPESIPTKSIHAFHRQTSCSVISRIC